MNSGKLEPEWLKVGAIMAQRGRCESNEVAKVAISGHNMIGNLLGTSHWHPKATTE